jgi:hypothetical protein
MGNAKMLPIDDDNINPKIAQIDTFHKIQKTIFRSKVKNYKKRKSQIDTFHKIQKTIFRSKANNPPK